MTSEIWKRIADAPRYEVSNKGRIRYNFNGRVRDRKLSCNKRGYLIFTLRRNGRHISRGVHRTVAVAFLGESDLHVNHKDGNKQNNNLDNLEFVTRRDNVLHGKLKLGNVTGSIKTSGGKYRSKISNKGVYIYLGSFDTSKEAQEAYLSKYKEIHGHLPKYYNKAP